MLLLFLSGFTSFITGLLIMKSGLEKLSLKRLKNILLRFTSTPLKGALTGMILTAIMQSSSVVLVIAIGLVNAGAMTFPQTLGLILGTNVGTTITTQIISFNITQLFPVFISAGIILLFFPVFKLRNFGIAFLGFGLLLLGLEWMKNAAEILQYYRITKKLLAAGNENLFLTILVSTLLTALFQSSSAIIGTSLALAAQKLINLEGAIAIVLGSNLGTCITAVFAASGGSLAARRAAVAHIILNAAGILVFFPLIKPFSFLISLTASELPKQIANAHTLYNLFSSLFILPFCNWYAHIIELICKGD